MPQRLRIFVCSPGDVPDERLRVGLIVDKLSQDYGRFFSIESYRWEHEALLASKHFQDVVEPPSAFDIVILILWSRLGTPLPQKTTEREYRGIDGRAPVTGTEWEYEEALKAARDKGAPDLLAFRNISPAPVDTLDSKARAESISQVDALDRFWRRHFADGGLFIAAFDEYRTLEDFARRVEESLRKLIEQRIKTANTSLSREPIWLGDPFRGLESYEFEHAGIFFGRDSAVTKATEQLAVNARGGRAFLLVSGASGSGKSSLVKAGIVPRLMKPQRISGMAFLRRVVFRPSTEAIDVFRGLANALARASGSDVGLPELIAPGQDAAQLATHLRGAAAEPGYLFGNALGRLTQAGRECGQLLGFEDAKLILVVDQLEELLTFSGITAEDRRLFIQLLAALSRSGAVWVIATLRADFWHRAAEIPEIIALAEGQGRLDLAAPSAAELTEMIGKPARAAGLSFETHPQSGLGLDAVLAEHAASAPGALPLLSFTLLELYQNAKARGEAVLTYASYESLGGLEGAIAQRADEMVAALPAAAQAALPSVLRSLATVTDQGDHAPVARPVRLANFAEGTPARTLIDAFVAGRLLVAAGEAGAQPNIRLAHEALIGRWQRARDQLAADRRDLETRAVIERQFTRWSGAGRRERKLLLLRNPDLANAIDVARRWGKDLDQGMRLYINSSYRQARLRQRVTAMSAVAFALIAIAAGVAADIAYNARQTAIDAAAAATQRLQEALLNQSRYLTQAAESQLGDSRYDLALLLSLEALPKNPSHPERPLWSPAVDIPENVYQRDRLRAVYNGLSVKFSPDSSSVLVWDDRGAGPSLWDLKTGQRLAYFAADIAKDSPTQRDGISGVDFSNGGRLLTYTRNKKVQLWDVKTAMAVGETSGRSPRFSPDGNSVLLIDDAGLRLWDGAASTSLLSQDNVEVATFDSDGRRVFVGLDDGSARILDAKTGAILTTLKASGQVTSVQFSTDGNSLLTTWDDHKARMWDATTGTLRFELDGVEAARFSPDSSHILTTGNNFDARIWDSATGQMQLALKHDAQVNWGSYSPDGKHIVTGTYDYSVTVWDAISGEIEYVLRGTDDSPLVNISEPAFSSDGRFIAAAFNGGEVRIWDARNYAIRVPGQSLTSAVLSPNGQLVVTTTSGKNDADLWDANRGALILTLQGHQARINSVVFSRDGSSILTGSNDGTVRIWDARTGDCIKVLNPDIGPISSANYTDDGQSVAIRVGAGGRKFQVLNLQTEEVLSTADRVMAWSANAKRVVAYAGSGTLKVQVLDLDSKSSVILEDVWDIDYAKFSPDGARVATYGPRVRIWDARTGADMLTLPRMSVEQVDFSPDGKRVVLEPEWPWDKVAVWDIDTRQKITEFDAGEIQAHDAIFSPDGKFVLTGHDGGTARLWDAQTGHSMGVLKTSGYVTKVQFSQDGHAILTTGETTAELWDTFPLAAENARAYASLIEVRDFTKDERKQFSLPPQDEAKSRFQADDPSVTDCDRQAANPVDPRKRTFGVQFANIKDEAVAACQSALKQNPDDPRLLYQLGRALQKQGSLAQALDMYQRSAAKEYAAAYNNLGNVYQSGNGVDRDIGKAIAYFEQAFQKGFPYAGFTIYGIYWNGQYVPQDRKTAVAWLNRAASQGEPQSNFRLAVLYEHGQEVTEDLNRALFHWAVAESLFRAAELDGTWPRGNGEYARLRRIALSRGMRSADVIETAKKVFDWSPNTAN